MAGVSRSGVAMSREVRLREGRSTKRPAPGSRVPAIVGPALVLALAAWMTSGVLGPGLPSGEDVTAHLVRADFAIPHLVARGRLDGWFPRFFVGHQEFLFNGPGLTWMMAMVRALALGQVSNPGALKIVALASFAALPFAVSHVARSFGLDKAASRIAAILALSVSTPFGIGLHGAFRTGLLSHQVGAVLFCVLLGSLLRVLSGTRRRSIAAASLSGAGLLATHAVSAIVFAVLAPLVLLARLRSGPAGWRPAPGAATRLLLAGGGALAFGAFWLLPFLAHRDLRGVLTTWGQASLLDRAGDILGGSILFRPAMIGAVLVGMAWGLTRRRRPHIQALAMVPPAYLLIAHLAGAAAPYHEVTAQLANRGLGYVGLIAVLPLADLLSSLAGRCLPRPGPGGELAQVVPLLGAVALVGLSLGPWRSVAAQLPEPRPAMREVASALAGLVPDGARFATQRDYPGEIDRTGVIHPEIWLARESGRNSLNGFNVESSSTPEAAFTPDTVDEAEPAAAADALSRLGVSHFVTTADDLADRLVASGRFLPRFRRSPLQILDVRPRAGQPAAASLVSASDPVSARLARFQPERLEIAISAPRPALVTVALAWSPKWHGRLEEESGAGRTVALGRTGDGLVMVPVAAGRSRLTLRFSADRWDLAGASASVSSVIAAGILAVRGRMRGRRRIR